MKNLMLVIKLLIIVALVIIGMNLIPMTKMNAALLWATSTIMGLVMGIVIMLPGAKAKQPTTRFKGKPSLWVVNGSRNSNR